MVLRVALVLTLLVFPAGALTVASVDAGGPPVCGPQGCPPPAYYPQAVACPPPSCGPRPFLPLGGLVGACTNICGTILGCPAALMQGLLSPPRKRCAPAVGPCMPPPQCMPMPYYPTRTIQKCKPAAWRPPAPPQAYMPPPMPQPIPRAMSCGPVACAPPSCGAPSLPCVGFCAKLLSIPFQLCGGLLSPRSCGGPVGLFSDGSAAGATPTFGCYW